MARICVYPVVPCVLDLGGIPVKNDYTTSQVSECHLHLLSLHLLQGWWKQLTVKNAFLCTGCDSHRNFTVLLCTMSRDSSSAALFLLYVSATFCSHWCSWRRLASEVLSWPKVPRHSSTLRKQPSHLVSHLSGVCLVFLAISYWYKWSSKRETWVRLTVCLLPAAAGFVLICCTLLRSPLNVTVKDLHPGDWTFHCCDHSFYLFLLCAGPAIASAASIVSTEISQVPLSGVLEMLKIARYVAFSACTNRVLQPHNFVLKWSLINYYKINYNYTGTVTAHSLRAKGSQVWILMGYDYFPASFHWTSHSLKCSRSLLSTLCISFISHETFFHLLSPFWGVWLNKVETICRICDILSYLNFVFLVFWRANGVLSIVDLDVSPEVRVWNSRVFFTCDGTSILV